VGIVKIMKGLSGVDVEPFHIDEELSLSHEVDGALLVVFVTMGELYPKTILVLSLLQA
jgi:hypothetical protein